MGLPTPTFLVGLILLAYLLFFVLFAFIRIATGISIQRLGISGLRRISFTPKDGIRIEIRGLGLSFHRPTFARPTWVSVVLTELNVIVDLRALGQKPQKKSARTQGEHIRMPSPHGAAGGQSSDTLEDGEGDRGGAWERLAELKERIKRLHRQIEWIRLVDLDATSTSLTVADVGSLQIGSLSMTVDTRRKTVDRSRLFNHHKPSKNREHRPAEWIIATRSILFTPEGKDSTEIVDHCTLNIYGMLYKELDGLRDASIALKLGRLSIPYDDLELCIGRAKACRKSALDEQIGLHHSSVSFADIVDELECPGSREGGVVRAISDSKEFASSIMRGIQEFQFAVGFFGLTKKIQEASEVGPSIFLNMSMKDVGLDLLRLDPRSPAHVMYFSRDDIAHQALLAAISISVGIDDGHGHPERLLYIPMATNTLNTTLPSKTIQYSRERNVADRNTNILHANLVVTSPSLDLDPKHLPLLLAMSRNYETSQRRAPSLQTQKHSLLRRLLPKATIKITIHEPVVRVTLPPMDSEKQDSEEFDLLISASSSVSLDVESSHAADGDLHYALTSTLRMNSQQLYYQTTGGVKHSLLLTDYLELKLQLSASPNIVVVVNGTAQTFSVFLVRPELSEGLRQIVSQIQKDVRRRRGAPKRKGLSFLRKVPSWLSLVQLQGSDFNIEVAGTDAQVSKDPRGVGLHLENWTAEYRQDKAEAGDYRPARRRAPSRTINRDEYLLRPSTPTSPRSPRRGVGDATDGRTLSVQLKGLEGFVLEAGDNWESEPFVSLPQMEVSFTTASDKQGPLFHVHVFAQALFFHYSLYRHFALGVAAVVLRRSFNRSPDHQKPDLAQPRTARHLAVPSLDGEEDDHASINPKREFVTLDVRSSFVQIKADMPSDPALMLHIYELEAGRHRWANPYLRSRLVRLHAESPHVKAAWARLVSVKSLRLDYRETKRRYGHTVTEDKSFDIATDAIRLAVPHQLVMHKVFDNIVNLTKTVEQLHSRFKTGIEGSIPYKAPKGPKHVPKITLRSRAVLFELEDDPFEFKLGVIYRYGLLEQKQRLAREHAFDLKVKKLQQEHDHRGSSRHRAKSAHGQRSRSKSKKAKESHKLRRSKSEERGHSEGLSWPKREHDRPETAHEQRQEKAMRYDKDGYCGLSGSCRTSIDEAREKLNRLNAQTWKKRIDHALKCQSHSSDGVRSLFWGLDDIPEEVEHKEKILAVPRQPPLMTVVVGDLDVILDKPSFPLHDYPKFLQRVGKGMPVDMQYSLLIPTHVQINMGEAQVQLRDYPLPLIHIPALNPSQSSRLPSLSLKTDFVIAEEYRDIESIRVCRVVVVPPEQSETGDETGGLAVDVRRTVSPVKTYSDMAIDINSSYPTRITWGTSYQPAIQDMMQVIENFTKPAIDPSERVGFWDKIRLTFHSRFRVSWKGDGDVHLILKGSRDPYLVTGHGTGFVMCWQNDVQLSIAEDEDPRNFMIVNSGVYVLAVPDLSHYARHEAEVVDSENPPEASSTSSYRRSAAFKKTIMKLNGNVRWKAGLVYERNLDEGGRSFEFIPHYKVVLKHPDYAVARDGRVYDAFRGFRSHHIHMSLAVAAPHDREWSVSNLEPAKTYNSVHLTPRFFTHFFNWWSMFSGAMSLPIRQGGLWPGVEKSSKKFGRHLATIKYSLLLSPLYMSHVYKHKDPEDYDSNIVTATGLKARVDSFMLDLHQRREEFRTLVQDPKCQEDSKQNQTTGMRINQVQLDLIGTDVRALSASIRGTDEESVLTASPETIAGYSQDVIRADLSKFIIPDNDWGWVDMDDFVDLGWMLPADRNPETMILPLAFAPRFTYLRQTDHANNISGDPHRTSPFGYEPTHHCVMSGRNDPRRIQCQLIEQRLQRIKEQLALNDKAIGEQELKIIQAPEGADQGLHERLDGLRNFEKVLKRKENFLRSMHESLMERLESTDAVPVQAVDQEDNDKYYEAQEEYDPPESEAKGNDKPPPTENLSDFNNRFIVHNVHLKWSNSLRNIILRYIHQVSQRRGFVYYMSRRAVKFILDIVEEQAKSKEPSESGRNGRDDYTRASSPYDDEMGIHERVQQILGDGKPVVSADDSKPKGTLFDACTSRPHTSKAEEDVSLDYVAQNAYIVRMIAPQIQLQSEKDKKSAVLIAAKSMQLKIIQIMDKDRITDDVSGLVQRRFTAAMDSLQIFVTNAKTFSEDIHMYSGSTYGTPVGSDWPPWVPFEVMFEFHTEPFGFQRVVPRTSASLRYDKFNTLRLKYHDNVTSGRADGASTQRPDDPGSRMDHLYVDFPHVRVLCNSRQYYAVYVIVLDLLLFSEPLEKTRTERLEKIMLASDFSDLTGAPDLVIGLQERIRQLEEIKTVFQVNEKYLDKQGWSDRIEVEKDLSIFEEELFFVMKAITTAQRKQDDRAQTKQSSGLLRYYISASEIVWHLLAQGKQSLAEFQLKNAVYDRTDNSDGSNFNLLEIEEVKGLNLLPDALYPAMISRYIDNRSVVEGPDTKMLRVHWIMLEAIAGIPVMDHFEVNLFPLKVQLEYSIGKKLFEYVFPGVKDKSMSNGKSPFLVKHVVHADEGDDDDVGDTLRAGARKTSTIPENEDEVNALKLRLKPTLHLPAPNEKPPTQIKPSHDKRPNVHHLRLFRDSSTRSYSEPRRLLHPRSAAAENWSPSSTRPSTVRTGSNLSAATTDSDKASRKFMIYRTNSEDQRSKKARSDDLTEMMSRASNYMTLAYVKIPSMVLCLSYKGKSHRNLEDVHNLVFRMPNLEYRNKTWSNLDLAQQIKKDVTRALFAHAGAIVSNKFTHHRAAKHAPSRLRQTANNSAVMNGSPDLSDNVSTRDPSPGGSDLSVELPSRRSFASGRGSVLSAMSEHTSLRSSRSGPEVTGSVLGPNWQDDDAIIEDGRGFADELSRVDQTEPEHANMIQSLSRHVTQLAPFGHKPRSGSFKGSVEEESEETSKKKSRILLGGAKKLFGHGNAS
ncbi:uncharacterized protein EI97DRAFT_393325 [Westerdykella ornata]|uniref:Mitochondrial protein from FMP27-domain-containing protein n=1 Tax=Westerdykella ornata TaxID=318751 RepID=A0A6A6JQP6_WESOR|nr:uncharacterized protein EI97DRAFT_393325 [Westerdykella ornata]KAF2278707.1 hypothetical protein EI97DRAFT_393325 [Westerdykella ornata]